MRTLKQIVKDIEVKKIESTADATAFDPRVAASVEGAARAAKMAIEDLTREYNEAILSKVRIIAVSGKDSAELANIAKYTTNTPVFDYETPINQIVEDIRSRGFGPMFTNQEYFSVLAMLNQMRITYNFIFSSVPKFSTVDGRAYERPIAEAVRNLIYDNYAGSLNSMALRHHIQTEALGSKFTGSVYPVIVYNYDAANGLDAVAVGHPYHVIQIPEDTADIKEFTKQALSEIKSKLSKEAKTNKEAKKEEEK